MQSLLTLPMILKLIPAIMIINVCLSGISAILQKLVDMGDIPAANSFVIYIAKAAGLLKTVADFVSANIAHK